MKEQLARVLYSGSDEVLHSPLGCEMPDLVDDKRLIEGESMSEKQVQYYMSIYNRLKREAEQAAYTQAEIDRRAREEMEWARTKLELKF